MSDGDERAAYKAWKLSVPMLYDWFANHHLAWPSLCCRWGPKQSEATYKSVQHLYLSERTDDSEANKLIVATAEVIKPRVAAAEQIINFKESEKSHHIKSYKYILHPGEINKIRELGTPADSNIVITHTDAKELYLWNVETQPECKDVKGADGELAVPDLVLEGHTDNAQFALGCSSAEPLVASGGQDTNVLIWNVQDHDAGSLLTPVDKGTTRQPQPGTRLQARTALQGHEATIEDVNYMPGSVNELVSVGDDNAMLLWDTRSGTSAAARVEQAHGDNDLHCVDWSSCDTSYIATGAADGSVKVWDRRRLSSSSSAAAYTFRLHTQATMRIEWAHWQKGILASGGEDGRVAVWDLHRSAQPDAEAVARDLRMPSQLMFQHMGHRAQVVDFQWHPTDKFTMVSVSEHDVGGSLQIWRINDLIYLPADEAIRELEAHREFILNGREPAPAIAPSKPGRPSAAAAAATANGRHTPTPPPTTPSATPAAPVQPPTQAATPPAAAGNAAPSPSNAGLAQALPQAQQTAPAAASTAPTDVPAPEVGLPAGSDHPAVPPGVPPVNVAGSGPQPMET